MKIHVLLAAAVVVVAACQAPAPRPAAAASPSAVPRPTPTMAQAIARAEDLGPAGAGTTVSLDFRLQAGRPEPALVLRAVAALNAAGMRASWQPPSSMIAADGPAPAAAALLGVRIESYRSPDGTTFYAASGSPRLPAVVAAVAADVSGLDDYRGPHGYAVAPGGLRAPDVLGFYDLKPLRDAGLDGKGQTILFLEVDDFNVADLNAFASESGLPPFGPILTVRRDSSWGTPAKPQGETVLDLEIAHEIAPAAKLVVYLSTDDFGHGNRAFDALVTEHLGSIISESLGACEPDTPASVRNLYASIEDRAIAQRMTHFVASGDAGAFTCGEDQDPAASFPSALPTVTAVGGTTVFESREGGYFKEYAWGSPLDETGSGGGASVFYAQPDWQKNEAQFAGHGRRQLPDVAADGDPFTGFHILFEGKDAQIGGTSAATPLWAATMALVNQDLKRKGLREAGFANPAIYWMGENAGRLNPRPFHDVVGGNNLGFEATPGWDFATGWGSMDGAGLDAAWIRYVKSGGA